MSAARSQTALLRARDSSAQKTLKTEFRTLRRADAAHNAPAALTGLGTVPAIRALFASRLFGAASSSSQPPKPVEEPGSEQTRGLKDVWKLIPNQIDYARIVFGLAPLFMPNSLFMWAAGSYLFSQFLDQIDGR
jgi:hypothetical protein